MKKVAGWMLLACCLSGCEKPIDKTLTCADDPKGRPKAEQTIIADDCFLHKGKFVKSPPMSW